MGNIKGCEVHLKKEDLVWVESWRDASELDTVQSKLEYSSEVRAAVHCAGLRVNMNDVGGQWEGKSEHVASCGGNMYIRERRGRVTSDERRSEGHRGQVEGALLLPKIVLCDLGNGIKLI